MGFTYIHIYIHFFQESLLSSFMSLPVHTFGKMPFYFSFLSKGTEFSVFFNSFFYHPSLPYQSMLLGGGACCIPSFSFIILHCSVIPYNQEKYTTHSFDRGPNFIDIYIYISFKNLVYHPSCLSHSTLLEKCLSTTRSFLKGLSSLRFSRISSIILHCSLNPCFWEGVDVTCQAFLLSSCIVLSFHTTRKTILPLFTPLIGDWFYIYLYIFQETLSSCIALSIHAFGRACMLHAQLFFYHPALLCLPYY